MTNKAGQTFQRAYVYLNMHAETLHVRNVHILGLPSGPVVTNPLSFSGHLCLIP